MRVTHDHMVQVSLLLQGWGKQGRQDAWIQGHTPYYHTVYTLTHTHTHICATHYIPE
jgi:hypothetical protein